MYEDASPPYAMLTPGTQTPETQQLLQIQKQTQPEKKPHPMTQTRTQTEAFMDAYTAQGAEKEEKEEEEEETLLSCK